MKRFVLLFMVAAGLMVPAAVFAGPAVADNPHGDKSDPSASCGKPGGPPCQDANLPQSQGCQHGNAPNNNPHCTPGTTSTPTPGTSGVASVESTEEAAATEGDSQKAAAANQPAGATAQSGSAAGELAFTGSETLWLTLFGAAMLASGLALRARARDSA
jgi:hypothetical protein